MHKFYRRYFRISHKVVKTDLSNRDVDAIIKPLSGTLPKTIPITVSKNFPFGKQKEKRGIFYEKETFERTP